MCARLVPAVIDPSLAPPGKHTLHAYLPATEPYELWAGLDRRSDEYKRLKQERSKVLWDGALAATSPGGRASVLTRALLASCMWLCRPVHPVAAPAGTREAVWSAYTLRGAPALRGGSLSCSRRRQTLTAPASCFSSLSSAAPCSCAHPNPRHRLQGGGGVGGHPAHSPALPAAQQGLLRTWWVPCCACWDVGHAAMLCPSAAC
jgi:hypothetical protein